MLEPLTACFLEKSLYTMNRWGVERQEKACTCAEAAGSASYVLDVSDICLIVDS